MRNINNLRKEKQKTESLAKSED